MQIPFDTHFAASFKKREFESAGHKCGRIVKKNGKHVLPVRRNPNGHLYVQTGDGWKLIGLMLAVSLFLVAPSIGTAQEPAAWNAFASQVEPVEGKKPKPDKNKHDDETVPTPAPAPEPDAKPEPIPKKPDHKKPHVVKPSKPDEAEGGHHNGDKTIDKTITNIVYRSSWTPSAYDLILAAWLLVLTLVAIATARRAGLGLKSLLMFWK